MKIGGLPLKPDFKPDIDSYTTATTNARNKVTATPEDSNASISILVNGDTVIGNGTYATWQDGENTLDINVTNDDKRKVYTVIVTKQEPGSGNYLATENGNPILIGGLRILV